MFIFGRLRTEWGKDGDAFPLLGHISLERCHRFPTCSIPGTSSFDEKMMKTIILRNFGLSAEWVCFSPTR